MWIGAEVLHKVLEVCGCSSFGECRAAPVVQHRSRQIVACGGRELLDDQLASEQFLVLVKQIRGKEGNLRLVLAVGSPGTELEFAL